MIAVVACPFPADLSMNETAAPVIVIVTLLGGDGPTGVEAHLHHIRQAALDDGATVYLVTPYTGYRLARAASETSIADVVTAVDEPLKATRCAGHGATGCMKGGARCLTHDLWEETGRMIHAYFAGISLADVIDGRFGRARAA